MRQDLMLGDILKSTQKEHPSFPASKTALGKARPTAADAPIIFWNTGFSISGFSL